MAFRRAIKYNPLPSQRKFHTLATKYKGFSGPIGSGKSAAFAQEIIRLAYANPGCWGLVGAPTYKMLKDATLRSILGVLTDNGIPFRHLKSPTNTIMLKDCGSEILCRSLDNPDALRGPNLAFFGVDELTYASVEGWNVLAGRLRDPNAKARHGIAAWTAKGYDFVWEKFVSAPAEDYDCVLAAPFENRYLPADYYESLKSSYSPEFYEQEVLGKYLNVFAGQVYKEFNRALDLRPVAYDWQLPISLACDFNVDPMAWVICQFDVGRRRLTVLDEIFLRNSDTDKAIKEFHLRMEPYLDARRKYTSYPMAVSIYGDASGSRTTSNSGSRSDWQIIREYLDRHKHLFSPTFKVPNANGAVTDRVIAVNSAFCNSLGERRVTVDPKCKELIKDFEQVAYAKGSSAIDQPGGTMRTHMSDAFGYLVVKEMGIMPRARIHAAA